MVNNQQRKFKKEMNRIEREKWKNQVEDPLSFRHEKQGLRPHRYRRPILIGSGGAILTVGIIIWRVFALYTWIHPVTSMPYTGTPLSSPRVSSNSQNMQQSVSDYIQLSNQTWQELNTLMTPLLNPNILSGITNQTFTNDATELSNLQGNIETNNIVLTPLKEFNQNQINLVRTIIEHIQLYKINRNPSEWNDVNLLLGQYNSDFHNQQGIMISILNKEHMTYQLNSNGSITYQYYPSSQK